MVVIKRRTTWPILSSQLFAWVFSRHIRHPRNKASGSNLYNCKHKFVIVHNIAREDNRLDSGGVSKAESLVTYSLKTRNKQYPFASAY